MSAKKATKAKRPRSIRAQFAENGLAFTSVHEAAENIRSLKSRLAVAEHDTRRMSWLSQNIGHELRLRQDGDSVEVVRWVRRYLTYYATRGATLREAVDAFIHGDLS